MTIVERNSQLGDHAKKPETVCLRAPPRSGRWPSPLVGQQPLTAWMRNGERETTEMKLDQVNRQLKKKMMNAISRWHIGTRCRSQLPTTVLVGRRDRQDPAGGGVGAGEGGDVSARAPPMTVARSTKSARHRGGHRILRRSNVGTVSSVKVIDWSSRQRTRRPAKVRRKDLKVQSRRSMTRLWTILRRSTSAPLQPETPWRFCRWRSSPTGEHASALCSEVSGDPWWSIWSSSPRCQHGPDEEPTAGKKMRGTQTQENDSTGEQTGDEGEVMNLRGTEEGERAWKQNQCVMMKTTHLHRIGADKCEVKHHGSSDDNKGGAKYGKGEEMGCGSIGVEKCEVNYGESGMMNQDVSQDEKSALKNTYNGSSNEKNCGTSHGKCEEDSI